MKRTFRRRIRRLQSCVTRTVFMAVVLAILLFAIALALPDRLQQLIQLIAPVEDPNRVAAKLVRVIDGDTIAVRIDGEVLRVRYIGMDTPEEDEPLFEEATKRNAALLADGRVYLEKDVSETDRYGRLLRYVYNDKGTLVNEALVLEGLAAVSTFPPDVARVELLRSAQQKAQDAQRGMWQ